MSFLQPLNKKPGKPKLGIFGFAGSGKTRTAIEFALGIREHLKLPGPIAMFDTETGNAYINGMVQAATGMDLVGYESRSLQDLIGWARECEAAGVSVAIVDSLSHIWKKLQEDFLAETNRKRVANGKRPTKRLEFQEWEPIKRRWAEWADFFLNSNLVMIACGRAGYEYEDETDDDGKRKIVKVGTKMKAEGEFGFEPSLVVEMTIENAEDKDGRAIKVNRATCVKDRFDAINFRWQDFPTFEFIRPHIEKYEPGSHVVVDTKAATTFGVDSDGGDGWDREKKKREGLHSEIQGLLTQFWPSTSAEEKKTKIELLHFAFGRRGWDKIVNEYTSEALEFGLQKLEHELQRRGLLPPTPPAIAADDDIPDFSAAIAPPAPEVKAAS